MIVGEDAIPPFRGFGRRQVNRASVSAYNPLQGCPVQAPAIELFMADDPGQETLLNLNPRAQLRAKPIRPRMLWHSIAAHAPR